jgi:hypothetical protein
MLKYEDNKKSDRTPYDRPMKAVQEEQPSGFLGNFTPVNEDLVYGRSEAGQAYFKTVPEGTRTVLRATLY